MKAFVISYNRLTWTKNLCENLADLGCEVILIDNGSTYEPLLDWYGICPFKIHFLPSHFGHKSLWESGLIKIYQDEYYIVTDHDLDISQVPKDFIDVLRSGLELKEVVKCGLSLKLSDLPDNIYTKKVVDWETKFWEMPKTENFFYSDIDTTLAVYSKARLEEIPNFFCALRADKPYEARHLPWYNAPENLTEEEMFYMKNIRRCAYWTEQFRDINGLN